MERRLQAFGPTVLVPAAWAFTLAATTGAIAERTVLIGLLVMDGLLATFFLTTRSAMAAPVLRIWQRVLAGGLALNLLGTAGLAFGIAARTLPALTVYAWAVLPGIAYVLTWRAVTAAPLRYVYLFGGAASLLGAVALAAGRPVIGLGVIGVGQTAGILAAAYQNAAG